MDKEYKCAWKHCKFDNVIKEDEDYEVINGRKYHRQCNCERENINQCITLFVEQVNDQIVMTQLRSVINNLIYNQGFESEYVVFSIQYAIEHPEYKLTYPQGLHRICKDQKIMDLWKNKQDQKIINSAKNSFVADDIKGSNLERKVNNSSRFSRVLGKKGC